MSVDLFNRTAHAELDLSQTDFKTVADAISSAGFTPVPLTKELAANESELRAGRRDATRLAVAGACAGNIMLFAFANYFGAPKEWQGLFSWLAFALYLPVVTYVAWPFYRGAYFALKNRRLSIDLPMAVASLAGFIFSTVELLRGREDIYFDSLAGFLFLILISRWAQQRLQKQFLQPREILETLQLLRVRHVQKGGWQWIPQGHLQAGQQILIEAGETLPADAELVDFSAHFSLAFLSGEAPPRAFHSGGPVPAGAKLITGQATLKVQRPLNDTAFGKLLAQTRQYSLGQTQSVQISDRMSQWLLLTVFSTAAVFLALYWAISPEEAVRRSLALIVLACPCAMAFGTPLALAAAIKRGERSGIIVRDGKSLEDAATVKTIFLDKTGTLTDTELSLTEPVESICANEQMIVLALERNSVHPIAFAFRQAFKHPNTDLAVQAYREIPGEGVEGMVGGSYYQLIRTKRRATDMACMLTRNGREVRTFHFQSRRAPGAEDTIAKLRNSGIQLLLLSGDSRQSAENLGRELGFDPATEIFADLKPEDKARMVKERPNSMMVGDGVNDSLALMTAKVGVAVSGGVEAALRSSTVLLTQPGIKGITELIEISRTSRRSIRINLTVSLIYNSTAGALALAGWINPYVAALLMPASSGLILLSTWLGGRR